MNYLSILLASLGAFVAYMVLGGAMFALIPLLKKEFLRYPAVYRDHHGQMTHMPLGVAGMFLAILALAALYALCGQGGSGLAGGARFGVLIGLFSVGSFVLHNYVNLNIGMRLTVQSAVAYLVQWVVVGMVIGLIYRPVQAA
jgi:hypothetical protein